MKRRLRLSGISYEKLKTHLFPGDGKEAVAIGLCGRSSKADAHTLLLHKLFLIPYDRCKIRKPDLVQWPASLLPPYLIEASKKGWGIVKFHSHPTGFSRFSETDDISDVDLFDSIYGWMDDENPHGSVIMLPNGRMFGRFIDPDLSFKPIERISVAGDDILLWNYEKKSNFNPEFIQRTQQAFGEGTTSLLNRLRIGVIGCSGTGSPVIEQLVRLGIGSLVLVDPDRVERKNLNRIINSTMHDAKEGKLKVDVLNTAVDNIGLNTEIITFSNNLYDDPDAIEHLTSCDVLFGCVDSADGRYLINQISSIYLIPYIDIGVQIIADGKGNVDHVFGAVHFIQPEGGSLKSRGLYSGEDLRAAGLYRTDPKEYSAQKKLGYIANVNINSPAVISLNMYAASMAVNEFIARIHHFRYDPSGEFAITRFSISDGYLLREPDSEPDEYLTRYAGRGDMTPVLNMPELG